MKDKQGLARTPCLYYFHCYSLHSKTIAGMNEKHGRFFGNSLLGTLVRCAKQRFDPQQTTENLMEIQSKQRHKTRHKAKGFHHPATAQTLTVKWRGQVTKWYPQMDTLTPYTKQKKTTLSTQGTHNIHVARCWCCFVIHSYGDLPIITSHPSPIMSLGSTIGSDDEVLTYFYWAFFSFTFHLLTDSHPSLWSA